MEGKIRECVFRHGGFTLHLGVDEEGGCYCSFPGSVERDRGRVVGNSPQAAHTEPGWEPGGGDVFREGGGDVFREVKEWLGGYFEGEKREMPFKLRMVGSEFEKRVWGELLKIGYGELVSYRTIAERLGIPGSVRAVANAIGRNHYSVLIPCHRVIRSDGGIGGYAGGIEEKIRLIELEAGKGGLFK